MIQEAHCVSQRLNLPYVPREAVSRSTRTQSVSRLLDLHEASFAYIVGREQHSTAVRHMIRRREDGRSLFVNPRQWPRVQNIGFQNTPLARAICDPSDSSNPLRHVVDATAGLGGTSLRIGHTLGEQCRITAIEASAPLACLLEFGLRGLAAQGKAWSPAASRIACIHSDAEAAFCSLQDPQPDVIYLNPYLDLRRPDTMDLFLQTLAKPGSITATCFHRALQVAQRRVVLRVPKAVDPLVAAHGVVASRRVLGAQSDYHVFDVEVECRVKKSDT